MTMRLNKLMPLSLAMSMTIPLGGLALSFFSLDKKGMNRLPFFVMSMFYFFLLIKIPPLGDLYRRYLEISAYGPGTRFSDIAGVHTDVLLYVNGWIFQLLKIPFFFIPAFYGGLMCYLLLASFRNVTLIKNSGIEDRPVSSGKLALTYFTVFSTLNILNLVLGIRYGTSLVFMIYAVTSYYSRGKIRCGLFVALSILMHFSMAFVLLVFLGSLFVRVEKKFVIPLSIFFGLLSAVALRSILPSISFMGVGDYAMGGYVDGSFSSSPNDSNTIVVALITRLLGFASLIFYLLSKSELKGFDRFLNVFIPSCFIMSISYTAMGRYLNIAQYLLAIRLCYIYLFSAGVNSVKFRILLRNFLVVFALLSLLVINIYTQRRTLSMGGLWSYAWTSPVFLLSYSEKDFDKYLNDIDYDGYWIKHR
ncbi:EpsG family protein [Pantoea sp. App145]|uniref:EpsG family protein n=1 Tax=Pantoea sp. App145 TaxID=3071567 RepID=UPI003A7F7047